MKTKVLIYCTKGNETNHLHKIYGEFNQPYYCVNNVKGWKVEPNPLNGKIVAECEVETEEFDFASERFYTIGTNVHFDVTKKEDIERYNELVRKYNVEISKQKTLLAKSCLNAVELVTYLDKECLGQENLKGYALHISNLKVFDKPLELSECEKDFKGIPASHHWIERITENWVDDNWNDLVRVQKAPQNMCWVSHNGERKVLISIQPQWVCKILNGEKTTEVRRKVLKGMVD